MKARGSCREFVNKVQRLRKNSTLKEYDQIVVFYEFCSGGKPEYLTKVLSGYNNNVRNLVRMPVVEKFTNTSIPETLQPVA